MKSWRENKILFHFQPYLHRTKDLWPKKFYIAIDTTVDKIFLYSYDNLRLSYSIQSPFLHPWKVTSNIEQTLLISKDQFHGYTIIKQVTNAILDKDQE